MACRAGWGCGAPRARAGCAGRRGWCRPWRCRSSPPRRAPRLARASRRPRDARSPRRRDRSRRHAALSRPGANGHRRRRSQPARRRCGCDRSDRRAPNARAARTSEASWRRCATAPPAAPTHSGDRSAAAASGAAASSHGGPGPCRSCRDCDPPIPPAAPARSWCARARRGSVAPPPRSAPTDSCAAASNASPNTPATPAQPQTLTASDATTDAPWPAKQNSQPPRTEASTHPRSTGPTANDPPVRACIYGLPCPGPPSEPSVVADRKPQDGPGRPLNRSLAPQAEQLARRSWRSASRRATRSSGWSSPS